MDVLSSPRALRRWSAASLIANMLIVVTGALVRLTKSGLGCPTWPKCDETSFVPSPGAAWHSYVEFGNRLLTFVLVAIAVGTALSAWRTRRDGKPLRLLRWLSIAVGLGIVLQAVVGGISVLMQLDPWVVGLHLVLSVALIVVCTVMVHQAYELTPAPTPPLIRRLVWATFGMAMLMMYLGTIVTGAGPHSGDGGVQRNGFDVTEVARVHSIAMWTTLALVAGVTFLSRGLPRIRRAGFQVLAIAVLQGLIGYAQYLTGLPTALVLAHVIGTTLFTVAVAHLWLVGGFASRPVPDDQNISGSSAAAMNTMAK
ncbi:MAG: COX15/CtaA family protein [Micropruina sp.]